MQYRTVFQFVVIALTCCISSQSANAQPALYSFDGPSYPVGLTTPFINHPPNSGGILGFTTSFTTSPIASAFEVRPSVSDPPLPFPGMSSNVLIAAQIQPLTLTFSTLVTTIAFPFAVDVRPNQPLGRLEIVTPSDSHSQASTGGNTDFQGGFLTYTDPAGFSTVTLSAFSNTNSPVRFAIDNLQITAVPEPSTYLLVGIGMGVITPLGYGRLRRAKRKRQEQKMARTNTDAVCASTAAR